MYNRKRYDLLRQTWHADSLPNMFDEGPTKARQGCRAPCSDNESSGLESERDDLANMALWETFGGLYQTFCVVFR